MHLIVENTQSLTTLSPDVPIHRCEVAFGIKSGLYAFRDTRAQATRMSVTRARVQRPTETQYYTHVRGSGFYVLAVGRDTSRLERSDVWSFWREGSASVMLMVLLILFLIWTTTTALCVAVGSSPTRDGRRVTPAKDLGFSFSNSGTGCAELS